MYGKKEGGDGKVLVNYEYPTVDFRGKKEGGDSEVNSSHDPWLKWNLDGMVAVASDNVWYAQKVTNMIVSFQTWLKKLRNMAISSSKKSNRD